MIIYDPVLCERYAQAVFKLAYSSPNARDIWEECQQIAPMFKIGSRLNVFLGSPQISHDAKLALLEKAFDGKVQKLLMDLLRLLVRKDRIDHVSEILLLVVVLLEHAHGVYEAEVATAVPIDEAQRTMLKNELERFTKLRLKLKYVVEAKLIGGVRFDCGDIHIDDTVTGKLHKLSHKMMAAVNL